MPLRFHVVRVDPKAPAWTWEVHNDYGRMHWEVTEGDIHAVIRDIERWYGMAFCRKLEYECECGGTATGYRVFGGGHSHWCPVSAASFDRVEGP